MDMPKYKDATYKGYNISFFTDGYWIWARVEGVRQYLGNGKNKTEALEDCEKTIDYLISVGSLKDKTEEELK